MADEKKKSHPSQPKANPTEGPPICVFIKDYVVPSGFDWCEEFPTSESLQDLMEPFKSNFIHFLDAVKNAGASTIISATYRPKERAYLMHFAWQISHKALRPEGIPRFPGVAIEWDHGDDEKSISAATEMCRGYKLKVKPALESQHSLGFAVDFNIGWNGDLSIENHDKSIEIISTLPRNGMNPDLKVVAATYGVIKFNANGEDPPHWSSTGK